MSAKNAFAFNLKFEPATESLGNRPLIQPVNDGKTSVITSLKSQLGLAMSDAVVVIPSRRSKPFRPLISSMIAESVKNFMKFFPFCQSILGLRQEYLMCNRHPWSAIVFSRPSEVSGAASFWCRSSLDCSKPCDRDPYDFRSWHFVN